jgi:hypothetical protein
MRRKRFGLNKSSVKDVARDFVDYDYLSKLSPEELDWLDKFSREYYNNDLTHDESVHKPPFKRLYTQHNSRNRDIWTNNRRTFMDLESYPGSPALPKPQKKDEGNGKD